MSQQSSDPRYDRMKVLDEARIAVRSQVREKDAIFSYHIDERRVARYLLEIQEMVGGAAGGGVDPIGLLIASHAALVEEKLRSGTDFSKLPKHMRSRDICAEPAP